MSSHSKRDAKLDCLRRQGTLNPRTENVSDLLFRKDGGEFFDPRDLVQVRYEMLRRADVDGESVSKTAFAFGVSRVSFYHARKSFAFEGLVGLVPKKRGPRGGHKLTGEVMAYLEGLEREGALPDAAVLAEKLKERFGLEVHPRSLQRALSRREKKRL